MTLDPKLLEILACPEDKGPLLYFADEDSLYNPRLKRRYAIRDDIPVMLIDEAERPCPKCGATREWTDDLLKCPKCGATLKYERK